MGEPVVQVMNILEDQLIGGVLYYPSGRGLSCEAIVTELF
jgi:hypothetical protein